MTDPASGDTKISNTLPETHYRAKRHGWLKRIVLGVRNCVIDSKRMFYVRALGMDLHPTCRFSLQTKFDFTNPGGVHVGAESYLAFGVIVLSHDLCRVRHCHTYIGERCFIGANAIIMPGIRVGDECIVGSGAVVTKDVPNQCIVGGNPAKVIREGIRTTRYGCLTQEMNAAIEADLARHETGMLPKT